MGKNFRFFPKRFFQHFRLYLTSLDLKYTQILVESWRQEIAAMPPPQFDSEEKLGQRHQSFYFSFFFLLPREVPKNSRKKQNRFIFNFCRNTQSFRVNKFYSKLSSQRFCLFLFLSTFLFSVRYVPKIGNESPRDFPHLAGGSFL